MAHTLKPAFISNVNNLFITVPQQVCGIVKPLGIDIGHRGHVQVFAEGPADMLRGPVGLGLDLVKYYEFDRHTARLIAGG